MTKPAHLITFVGALLAGVAIVAWMVGPYLQSLFLGGTLAMLAYPAYRRLKDKTWGPRAAAAAITGLMLALVLAPLAVFSFVAVREGRAIGEDLAGLKEFSTKEMTATLSRWPLVSTLVGDPATVNTKLKGAIQAAGQFTRAAVVKIGEGVPEFILRLALVLTAFFFFLRDGERFMNWLLGLGLLDRRVQEQLIASFRETAVSAVLSGLSAAAFMAALISGSFLMLDVPGAILAGGLTFVFAWIPVLGTAPALTAGSIYLYVQGEWIKLYVLISLGVAASVVEHLLRTLVLRGRAGMHPLVGLVAIISGIQMFGILGVLLGPILAAMLLALLRIWPVVGSRFGIQPTAKT